MKKVLSLILALLTLCSLATTAFAAESVDNTFDNFTPAPGTTAPENWYDPWCYDSDGTFGTYNSMACYCKIHHKIFVGWSVYNKETGKYEDPYEILLDGGYYGGYCPYCGIVSSDEYGKNHERFLLDEYIGYGVYCPDCKCFMGNTQTKYFTSDDEYGAENNYYYCVNCHRDICPITEDTVIYRAVNPEVYDKDFGFIIKESENKWGEGKDINMARLKEYGGLISERHPGDGTVDELTFLQKVARIFRNIFSTIENFFSRVF